MTLGAGRAQEDRQKSEALVFFQVGSGGGAAAELAVRQPLDPPLAALRDAMLADAGALQRKVDELRDCLEVRPQMADRNHPTS